jgi:hypothetical protein
VGEEADISYSYHIQHRHSHHNTAAG